jgi:predicted nucleic acid-binding protein
MTDLVFVDTNVVIYARDARAPEKRAAAIDWLKVLEKERRLVISPQVLNEAYAVSRAKLRGQDPAVVRDWLRHLLPFCTAPLDADVINTAFAVEADHGFSWWDCLIVASALAAGCRYLLTEDLQHRQIVRDLRIVNPFVIGPRELPRLHK